jgi:hypothetical protein
MMKPEQSKPVDGLDPPHTYGTPRYWSAIGTTCSGAAGTSASYVGTTNGRRTSVSRVCGPGPQLSPRAGASLRSQCLLALLFFGSHLAIVLDESSSLFDRRLRLDRLFLCPRSERPCHDRTRLLKLRVAFRPPYSTLDRPKDLRVLTGDPLDRVEPRDDVVEAARAEDHLERRVTFTVDI